MKPEIKEIWLKALRSDAYRQGEGALYKDDAFCCLGVLCDLYSDDQKVPWKQEESGKFSIYDQSAHLPVQVMRWAGLDDRNPLIDHCHTLAYLNDHGVPFETIADKIEAQL